MDNSDFAKSSLENALHSELRNKIAVWNFSHLGKTYSNFKLDLGKEKVIWWEFEEIIKEKFDTLFLELYWELISTL